MKQNFQERPSALYGFATLSIPIAIIAANLLLPLHLIVRQALIGIVLIWFYAELLAGFPFMHVGIPGRFQMKNFHFEFTPSLYTHSARAILVVIAVTVLFLGIGRNLLGEAVIGLLYLVPVIWSAARWGQGPGMAAALSAALLFDFYFIPPFYTFTVGSLEGWLVLAIFLVVAGVVVGRIQSTLTRAQNSEREAVLMYELSTILAQAPSQEAIASGVARFLQQRYLATLVTVSIQLKGQATEITAYEPQEGGILTGGQPDRVLALLDAWGLAGEIQIWQGQLELPQEDSRLFHSIASQAGHVLQRTHTAQSDAKFNTVTASSRPLRHPQGHA